jgi:predicted regulator of Ras-like GTPase activity (Roadblock/LC7/MglB family)
MLSQALTGLRDVEEVQGSFVVEGDGSLIARDLPPVFHAQIFADVGPRLARLREMFDGIGGAPQLTMRFSDHKLHVRAVGTKLLCVLTGAAVNVPALRMAMSLVARQVEAFRGEPEAPATSPSARPTFPAPPGPPSSGNPASRNNIIYRGNKL